MKVLTIVGTRPELIRLSIIIKKLDILVNQVLLYTNQNYDINLSILFFNELDIRTPNYYFQRESKSFGDFLGNAILEFEKILLEERPDKILVLGDTNSGLLSIVAEKYKIPVYHMEAGNRCYDERLPEEVNRKIIDAVSKYNLPYTENSKQNLLGAGFHKNYVFKTGNPIYEVLNKYMEHIDRSEIINDLNLKEKEYVLVTVHRSENVDSITSLNSIVLAINKIAEDHKVVISLHPRTKNKLDIFKIELNKNVIVSQPLGFFDFVCLEKHAKCVISDSGTVPEECCIFGVPALIIRETTERQEMIECGSSILCGTKTENIINAFDATIKRNNRWYIPDDYLTKHVSDIVINILLGKI